MPFKQAAVGWAEREKADHFSWLFASVGWEAANIVLTCRMLFGMLLCRSWRPRLEVVVPFLPSLGCVGKLSHGGGPGSPSPSGYVWGAMVWTLACGWAMQLSWLRNGLAGQVPKGRLQL